MQKTINMEQQTFTIKNFLRITDPNIQHRRMTYPPEQDKYLIKTVYGYIKTMSHDMAPREEEAERGSREYELFNKYVKNEFKTDLTTLFIGKESEEYKINQLDKWWNSYKKQER